jgi:hypothetical protein
MTEKEDRTIFACGGIGFDHRRGDERHITSVLHVSAMSSPTPSAFGPSPDLPAYLGVIPSVLTLYTVTFLTVSHVDAL